MIEYVCTQQSTTLEWLFILCCERMTVKSEFWAIWQRKWVNIFAICINNLFYSPTQHPRKIFLAEIGSAYQTKIFSPQPPPSTNACPLDYPRVNGNVLAHLGSRSTASLSRFPALNRRFRRNDSHQITRPNQVRQTFLRRPYQARIDGATPYKVSAGEIPSR